MNDTSAIACRERAPSRSALNDTSVVQYKVFFVVLFLLFLLPPWFTNQSAAQVPISFGQTISSSISSPGEQDEYSFIASAGDVVLVRVSTVTTWDTEIRLFDPNGDPVTENFVTGPDTVEVTPHPLSITGTYSVMVSDHTNTKTGSYWIFLQRLNNPGMADQIDFGETLPGSISSAQEIDTYTFQANAGDMVLVRMSTDTNLDPMVWVYDPNGVYVTEDFLSGPDTSYQEVLLEVTGTYTLLIEDWADLANADFGTETGAYWIYVQRLNNPGMKTHIDFGQTLSNSITSPFDVATYTFDVLAGDRIWLKVNTEPGLDPFIRLFAPDGSYETEDFETSPLDDHMEFITTGTYTLLVHDWAYPANGDYGQGTGNYWIFVQRLNNPGMATQTNFAQTLPASISSAYEMDTYTFDALAGDVVFIRLSTNTGLDPELWLYGPDGSYVDNNYSLGPDTVEILTIPLPLAGTYTLVALDWADTENADYGTETGNYWLFVQRLNNPGAAMQIVFGETLSASISSEYEVDTYRFDALQVDMVTVGMSTDTGMDPGIRLFGPDGSYITEEDTTGPGTIDIEPEAFGITGPYTVLAQNSGTGKETGGYTISLHLKTGDPGSLTITPGEGLHASGLVGGPFDPLITSYTLENNGSLPIQWSLTKTQDWLGISSESGTVEAGTNHAVTVSINAEMVNGFPVGTYTDTLTFTNTTEANRRFIRSVSLRIDPIEGILEVTPIPDAGFSGPPGGPFGALGVAQYTLKNVGQKPMNWRAAKTAFWLSLSTDHGVLEPAATTDVTLSLNEVALALSKGVRTDTVTFTNQSNGYGNTSRNVILAIGVSPSEITAELSQGSIILGEPLQIAGKITPAPCDAGAWVDVVLIPPSGPAIHQSVIANTLGEFSYSVACGDIKHGGSWTVHTSWSGDRCLGDATSDARTLEVAKTDSRVTVDAGSRAVKLGEVVDISGKFTPDPDCGADLMGRAVKVLIFGPDGRSDIQSLTANDRFGHYVLQDYQGFNALGQWNVQALFLGDEAYGESRSEVINVQVVETAGYAVIVEGRIENEEGLASHTKTTAFVYEQFRQRGLLDDSEHDDIRYFTYDTSHPGYDGIPSKSAAKEAITEWARDKMNTRPANLYIVFLDHGLEERFFVYPDEISSSDLGHWLDTLQNDLFGQAAVQEIVMMLGFCRSGSFLDELAGWNRVVIASAAADESSYKGPLDPGDPSGVRDGEFFITEFFKGASLGRDVLSCFREAALKTEIFTSRGTGESNAPFRDDSRQHPLLDDNSDGIGENNPSGDPGYDGHLSRRLFIGVSSVTGNDPGDVQVTEILSTQFLGPDATTASFRVGVDNNTRMRSLWLEVKAPGYEPAPGGSEQIEMDLPRHAYEVYDQGQNRYVWNTVPGFTTPGTYQVFFFARDDVTGNESSLKQTVVYKAKSDNNPPQTFDLLAPLDGSEVRTVLTLDWADTADPDGDPLTYAVEISEGSTFDTVIHRAKRLSQSHYFVSKDAGLKDLTTYYWRVIAIDLYGASTPSNQVWRFKTDNTNEMMGWIKGLVYNSQTGQAITDALINVGSIALNTTLNGYYLGVISPGTYQIEASANGYMPKSAAGVVIPQGSIMTTDFGLQPLALTKGDVDGDLDTDLVDVILTLQILAGITPSSTVNKAAGVNADSKIGLDDLIYILQIVAELR